MRSKSKQSKTQNTTGHNTGTRAGALNDGRREGATVSVECLVPIPHSWRCGRQWEATAQSRDSPRRLVAVPTKRQLLWWFVNPFIDALKNSEMSNASLYI